MHESASVQTLAQLDEKLPQLEKDLWDGPLPFPVLIDRAGETVQRYGIRAYPTLVLIDPEGRVVRGGSLELLKEKLGIKD